MRERGKGRRPSVAVPWPPRTVRPWRCTALAAPNSHSHSPCLALAAPFTLPRRRRRRLHCLTTPAPAASAETRCIQPLCSSAPLLRSSAATPMAPQAHPPDAPILLHFVRKHRNQATTAQPLLTRPLRIPHGHVCIASVQRPRCVRVRACARRAPMRPSDPVAQSLTPVVFVSTRLLLLLLHVRQCQRL